jgi:2-polyprenyl-3-methyl-5-hydroxy-6-metoxy-1,4-benzoquinol methylase
MNTLSKTLDVGDYSQLEDVTTMVNLLHKHGIVHRFEHTHRRWEYGMTLKAILSLTQPVKSILDVGGGGSVFAPWATLNTKAIVTQVDPGDITDWIGKQFGLLGRPTEFHQEDFLRWDDDRKFDAVTCLSVIEHVPHDIEFFSKLLDKVADGGLLCLTTDFHPSGQALVGGHIRTYNADSMKTFMDIAFLNGFTPFLGEPDYSKFTVEVNSYTFASLMLRKDNNGNSRISGAEQI